MKPMPLLPMVLWLLGGCTPDTNGQDSAPAVRRAAPSARSAGGGQSAQLNASGASYEVSIASAESDRVRARELCDSKSRPERSSCNAMAEAAYDKAKSEAANNRTDAQ